MGNLINKIFLAGMIGAGSLGIFGNNGYGQTDSLSKKTPKMIEIRDANKDKIPDVFAFWEGFQDTIKRLTFLDTTQDGKIEGFYRAIYLLKEGPRKSTFEYIPDTLMAFQNDEEIQNIQELRKMSIGKHYLNCKENYFEDLLSDFW